MIPVEIRGTQLEVGMVLLRSNDSSIVGTILRRVEVMSSAESSPASTLLVLLWCKTPEGVEQFVRVEAHSLITVGLESLPYPAPAGIVIKALHIQEGFKIVHETLARFGAEVWLRWRVPDDSVIRLDLKPL